MSAVSQLSKRFREVLLDGLWIANTNFKDQLSDVSWEQAVIKIDSLNTIAMLTFHIDYYIAGLVQVFEGGDLEIKDKFSFDLPAVKSQEQWESLLNKLWADSENFASLLEQMSDSKLDEVFVDEKYGTYRRNIEGMIEHSYYHLGQITLIRKLLKNPRIDEGN
ncbi:DinB family protein [Chryseobacterium arthrosphaerae]|uniref:DinB family protein n=1 Tax=Chryseobacterium arthrosphaerae TaxID=651561 RepID=UPI001F4BC352|nr:DinB family protein [Chryseobacterium arthrosphaerae]MDG4651868.1 DinB family protein [Chryseobacterium arthrosphaerae]